MMTIFRFSLRQAVTRMFESYPDVITAKDLQKMLGIGHNTTYELLRSHTIPNIKVGRQIRISKQSVIDYLTTKPQNTAKAI